MSRTAYGSVDEQTLWQACIYECICIHMYVNTYKNLHRCTAYARMHVCLDVCMPHGYVCMFVCLYVYVSHVCVNVRCGA